MRGVTRADCLAFSARYGMSSSSLCTKSELDPAKMVADRGHALRHACAARLLAEGLTLKGIGDHLGHRSTSATSIYAKVNMAALREVGAFDLGDVQ